MTSSRVLRAVAAALLSASLVACDNPSPTPSPAATSSSSNAPSPGPSSGIEPSPTSTAITEFPLAVVTGLTNLKANISIDELAGLAGQGKLLVPCGVTVDPASLAVLSCTPAVQIAAAVEHDRKRVALLLPGLVEPATKVLPIAGDGPYGLFGPDLFGDPDSRALPYPITGRATGEVALDPSWTNLDTSQVWTLTETGSLCADRLGAYQAVKLGKGWDWVFDGGTARYSGKPFNNPNPPAGIISQPIVKPIDTGNDGATSSLIRRADVTLGNLKCPVLPTKAWAGSYTGAPSLSVPEAVLPRWKDFLGIDAVYLPADHQSDRGVRGIRSTLDLVDKHGFPHTGLGMDLDQALEPAYVEVAGLKVAFVAWNNVPGPAHADATTPGVAWLTKANVNAAVARARSAGAGLVVCDPQWWGPDEYLPTLSSKQERAVGWMDAAGCDQVLAGGLHVSGAVYLRPGEKGPRLIDAGPGNFQYGQDWSQDTQEGVVVELTFRGTTLVNVRLHPYVMILAARAALLDPQGDGHYVLQRIWKDSELDYRP
ncbi:MAG TPA: CapA family protein [Patescibacteria group bacterium]|nr:CapA family protein [Patescibacteria group bacterium]